MNNVHKRFVSGRKVKVKEKREETRRRKVREKNKEGGGEGR